MLTFLQQAHTDNKHMSSFVLEDVHSLASVAHLFSGLVIVEE